MVEEPNARGTAQLADGTAKTAHDDLDVKHASDAATLVPATGPAVTVVLPPPGYLIGVSIGRGGMGEVLSAQDLRIGREVAVKRMTSEDPDREQVSRFLREARIQARLEHPAIVPVHELGVDAQGRPY